MAHVINDDCISCGACASTCPVDAISEGASHYEVNAETCIDCGACEDACPTSAIKAAE
ncbi:MAG: 4Fe-4S binding protein [Catonella sp.]|nr:4Fe-4S binding protein [Catonella sp.]MDY6356469.1 4Fe-4S binding protein [Catonella sp.]